MILIAKHFINVFQIVLIVELSNTVLPGVHSTIFSSYWLRKTLSENEHTGTGSQCKKIVNHAV